MKIDGVNDSLVAAFAPTGEGSYDFIYPIEGGEPEQAGPDLEQAGKAFHRIQGWLFRTQLQPHDQRYLAAIAMRAIAAAWVINPDLFGCSLRGLAERLGGRGTRTTLSRLSAQFSREFPLIRNRYKAHDSKHRKK